MEANRCIGVPISHKRDFSVIAEAGTYAPYGLVLDPRDRSVRLRKWVGRDAGPASTCHGHAVFLRLPGSPVIDDVLVLCGTDDFIDDKEALFASYSGAPKHAPWKTGDGHADRNLMCRLQRHVEERVRPHLSASALFRDGWDARFASVLRERMSRGDSLRAIADEMVEGERIGSPLCPGVVYDSDEVLYAMQEMLAEYPDSRGI